MSDAAIAKAWATDPSLRSFQGQKMLADLGRTKLVEQRKAEARRNAEQQQWDRESRNPVQRPGASFTRAGQPENARQLPNNFSQLSTRNQMRAATQAIAKARGNGATKSSGIV